MKGEKIIESISFLLFRRIRYFHEWCFSEPGEEWEWPSIQSLLHNYHTIKQEWFTQIHPFFWGDMVYSNPVFKSGSFAGFAVRALNDPGSSSHRKREVKKGKAVAQQFPEGSDSHGTEGETLALVSVQLLLCRDWAHSGLAVILCISGGGLIRRPGPSYMSQHPAGTRKRKLWLLLTDRGTVSYDNCLSCVCPMGYSCWVGIWCYSKFLLLFVG